MKKRTSLSLDAPLLDQLHAASKKLNTTYSAVVTEALRRYFKDPEISIQLNTKPELALMSDEDVFARLEEMQKAEDLLFQQKEDEWLGELDD